MLVQFSCIWIQTLFLYDAYAKGLYLWTLLDSVAFGWKQSAFALYSILQFILVIVIIIQNNKMIYHITHTHTRLTALFPGLPRWAGTRKAKPIWILLKQETVSGSGISWNICKSAPCSRQITMPSPHHSVFDRPDALPAAQPTASKHWRLNDLPH